MRSDNQDVFFSGNIRTDVVTEYTFDGLKHTPNPGQGNMQSSNVTFAKNSTFIATSEQDGNLQVLSSGTVRLGEGADVLLDTSDDSPYDFTPIDYNNEQAPSLHVQQGSVVLEKNAKLTINSGPTRKKTAIFLEQSGSKIELKEGSELSVNLVGNDTNGVFPGINGTRPIQLSNNTSLTVGTDAIFSISSTGTKGGQSPIMSVGLNAKFMVSRKGSFIVETDGTGNKAILDMGSNADFRFTDAQSVDIKFLNSNVHTNSRLINMTDPGNFIVDVQKVNTWTKGANIVDEDVPNFKSYAPMFGMRIPYNGPNVQRTSSKFTAASTTKNTVDEFKANFNTYTGNSSAGYQRLQYEFIPDVDLTIDTVATDVSTDQSSTTVSGTATPGSYLRLSTTPIAGSGRPTEIDPKNNGIKSPVELTSSDNPVFGKMLDNFTLIVPASGKYTYTLPSGNFNAGTEIEVYGFKDGKEKSVYQTVLDETPPIGESNEYLEVEGGPVPLPSVFVKNPTDTHPLPQNFTYEYKTDINDVAAMMSVVGTHEVEVYVIDNAGKKGVVKSNLIIFESDKRNVLEASDISITQNELKQITNLEEYILTESKAEAYKIVNNRKEDFTNKIKVTDYGGLSTSTKKGVFDVTLEVPNEPLSKKIKFTVIPSEVEMTLKQVYKGTDDVIYSDLKNKTPITNYKENVTIGDSISELVDQLITDKKLVVNHDGFVDIDKSKFIIKVDGKKRELTEIPDDPFDLIFEYEGQMFFESVPDLKFGQINTTKDQSVHKLPDKEKADVEIVNTLQHKNWELKVSLPKGIKKGGKPTGEEYLGELIYYGADNSKTPIGIGGTKLLTQDNPNELFSELDMKGKDNVGMRLTQKIGNSAGNYQGDLLWSLDDVPE